MPPVNINKIPRHLLHAYTCQELPFRLLRAFVETAPKLFVKDKNRIGPLGLTPKSILRLGCREQNIDRMKHLELGCRLLRQLFQTIRLSFHMLRIEEWYLMALSLYASSDHEQVESQIHSLAIKSWAEYRKKIGEGVPFAETTWLRFKNLGGKI